MSDHEYHKIPGIFPPKANAAIHYAHIVAVFVILIIILILISIVGMVVDDINTTVQNTQELITDMNELLPEARLAIETIYLACNDTNFTKFYPLYARKICNSTI